MRPRGVPLDGERRLVTAVCGGTARLALARKLDRVDAAARDTGLAALHDLVAAGARPLTLQYRHLGPEPAELLAAGMLAAAHGATFLGGTSEEGPARDLTAFAVGIAQANELPGRSQAIRGDVLVGLPTPALSEGSLARVLELIEARGWSLEADVAGMTLGEALLAPGTSHVSALLGVLGRYRFKASLALGGGLSDLHEVLPQGRDFRLLEGAWPVPPVFEWLAASGGISPARLRGELNRGLAVVLVVSPERVAELLLELPAARAIGEIA